MAGVPFEAEQACRLRPDKVQLLPQILLRLASPELPAVDGAETLDVSGAGSLATRLGVAECDEVRICDAVLLEVGGKPLLENPGFRDTTTARTSASRLIPAAFRVSTNREMSVFS